MDAGAAVRIAKRFITLPLEKRKAFLARMLEEGVSPANLPIPEVRQDFATLPLSYAQQRQWFLWQLEPQSPAYNLSAALRLRGEFDVALLEYCLNQLVVRHEGLRTRFVTEDEQTRQQVDAQLQLKVQVQAAHAALAERAERIEAFVDVQGRQLFDLQAGPLMQVAVLELADDDRVLMLTQHHIISDGVSLRVLVEELITLYTGAVQGQQVTLPPLAIQYADYAIWQRHWMEAGELERQLSYWTDYLGHEQPVLELPIDHPRPMEQSFRGGQYRLTVDNTLLHGLQRLAQSESATLFMVLLAALQLLLQRYSGQHDIRIGVPMANRNRVETEGTVGFFVNTQVLRGQVDPQQDFIALLRQARISTLGAQAHQDLPFEQLVDALQPERSLSRNALFQVMFNHQRSAQRDTRLPNLALPGLQVEGLERDNLTAQFDLTLDTFEHENGLSATFNYAADLFEPSTIERLAGHWHNLLQAIVAAPRERVGELSMLGATERQALQQSAPNKVAQVLSVPAMIADHARRNPEQPAVLSADATLSYGELERQACRLAADLLARGVGPDARVGIALERGPQLLVAALAVLKVGAAFVPLDSGYPHERLAYMIADSGLMLLLSQTSLLAQLPVTEGIDTLLVDDLQVTDERLGNEFDLCLDGLAYVIYTSGSTGQPKGVAVSHRGLAMHCQAAAQVYGIDSRDCTLQFASPSFDAAWEQMFMPLCQGARVVMEEVGQWSPERLCLAVTDYGISVLDLPPAYLLQQAVALRELGLSLRVRACILGGEGWDRRALEALQVLRAEQLFNAYGPTEAVISPLIWRFDAADTFTGFAPIGLAVGARSVQILDDSFNLIPNGHVGEIHLGGEGLARGYLDRPSLTAQQFVPDPFSTVPGSRLYRSADLGRRRTDGIVEYRGRSDDQVKIRGLRIELGEIEARLLACTGVREAVVLAQPGASGQQLVAYVVHGSVDEEHGVLRDALKRELKRDLPDYMVPAHLMFLEQLPLTRNGKLDRKALPVPDASQLQQTYEVPRSELEQRIAAIWQDVLRVERVGLSDNFFELGGDSIVSIQVVSRARQAGIHFSPKQLFQHQTVQGLASVAQQGDQAQVIDQRPASGETALLPVQQAFFESAHPQPSHWNQSVLLKPQAPLQAAALEDALLALVAQHDALRLRFEQAGNGQWRGRFGEQPERGDLLWQADVEDLQELDELAGRAQRSLDLEQGVLLRAVLAQVAGHGQRLLLVIHHLAVDGVSWRILFDDLQSAYRQALTGQLIRLPGRTSSVQAWATRLHDHARSVALLGELDYWQMQQAKGNAPLPLDRPDGGCQQRHARTVHCQLDRDSTRRLLQESPVAYRTQVNDLLLTALARVLTRWTGQPHIQVQLEGHGREGLFDDIDLTRTVGWFTSLFPVLLTPASSLGDSLKAIKEQLRAVPGKGLGYGVLRYLGDASVQAALRAPALAQVTFNYLGQFDGSFDDAEALLRPSGEAHGQEQSDQALLSEVLGINGQVFDGRLSLGWTFSGEQFDDRTIQTLADAYVAELRALVEHCCACQGVTPSDFPLANLDQLALDGLPVPAGQVEDLYPLSPMQQGMLFHSLYEQGAGDYVNQMRLDIHGLDPERFRQAWQGALDANEILRTGFLWQGQLEKPLQLVHRQASVPFTLLDRRGCTDLDRELQELARVEYATPFDMTCAPLLRLVLVRIADQSYHLIYSNHHILLDGWSNSQLLGEVLQRYNGQALPERHGRYRDYIGWLQERDAEATEQFWRARLAGLEELTLLAKALPRPARGVSGHANHYQWFDAEHSRALEAFARAHKVTVNTLLQAAWSLLLRQYSGQQVVCFGATVSGRPVDLKGVEQQIGLFINTLPVIAEPHGQLTVVQWLHEVQALNLMLREQEHTPLNDIQRWAGQGGEALFDSLLVFENYPVAEALEQGAGETLRFGAVSNFEQTNYALTLSVNQGQAMSLHYSFNLADFTQPMIERVGRHLEQLLQSMLDEPSQRLWQLELLSEQERVQAICGFNATATEYPLGTPVQRLIEAQVQRTPDAEALVFGTVRLSYAQLDARANQLANRLVAAGVGPDALVGIAAERSLEMVVGLLAILKAGGAYVPFDPELPTERLSYLFEDSGIELLLTQSHLTLPLPEGLTVLALDQLDLSGYSTDNPNIAVAPENLAYVIYTSGSTGKPKGAGNRHSALTNRLCWMQQAYGLDGSDTVLQKTPFSFDVSVWEFFWPLMTGARLAVAGPGDHRDPARLVELIHQHDVTTLHFVPSMLQAFVLDAQVASCSGLKRIVCSGEALPVDAQQQVFAKLPQAGLYNLYGPTEAAIDVTHWTCREEGADTVPIGQPIANLATYVLDAELNPAPLGVIGELYLGGEGLARGYHRRPALTAERFVTSPFGAGERLYRTGDLARQRVDGVIEYAGRIDHQVKIRGLRIELGEIEARLMELDAVREAVVVAAEGARGTRLVGYVVAADTQADEAIFTQGLARDLAVNLPEYMLPTQWVLLAQMPLSPNGKLDRKALPAPGQMMGGEFVLAQTAMERALVEIWAAVLGLEQVSVTDNFFELGGDSITSIQVVSRARALGITLAPKDIFQQRTVRQLARLIEAGTAGDAPIAPATLAPVALHGLDERQVAALDLDHQRVTGLYRLSPMQQGMLLMSLDVEGLYVNQLSLPIQGLDTERFKAAWIAVSQRHDALRTGFYWQGLDEPVQFVMDELSVPVHELDWSQRQASVEQIEALADVDRRLGFSMDRPPLQRLTLVRTGPDSHQLIWTYHHILLDGWSVSQMLGEVLALYSGQALEPVVPYADYIAWLQRQDPAASEMFWREQLGALEAPTYLANAHPVRQGGSGFKAIYSHFGAARTECFKAFAREQQVTLNTLVQAAWLLLLSRYSGQRQVVFGATVAGRPVNLEQAERMLGCFINTLPVVAEVTPHAQVGNWLRGLQDYNLALRELEYTPLNDVQRWAGQPGQALFDTIIVFENHPVEQSLQRWSEQAVSFGQSSSAGLTNLPMDLMVTLEEGLVIEYAYLREFFDDAVAEAIRIDMEGLLDALSQGAERCLGEIGLPRGEARARLGNPARVEQGQPVHLRIAAQAQQLAGKPAVISDGRQLSFAELDRQANRLANALVAQGVGPEVRVGIALPRSEQTLVAMLAVLKAGGCYIPLDISHPAERLAYMMIDSGMTLLLCDGGFDPCLVIPTGVRKLLLEERMLDGFSAAPPATVIDPGNLAYVIYTSGSTGQPKGVAVAHGPLAAHCRAIGELYEMGPDDCELHFMSFAFDGAQERWITALSQGARLVVRDDTLWTPEQTYQQLHQHGVTVAAFPPVYLQHLADHAEREGNPPAVRIYCFGGDAVPEASFDRVKRALAPKAIFNGYGPTETVVTPLLWRAGPGQGCGAPYAPIGELVGQRTAHVLDADLNPLPAGIAGELYLGGHGVARGYLGRPGLSAERFIADPFVPGGRLYRTGDLVRERADGVFDYLGRIDHQVKIRGFRIELGEIEARLCDQPGVAEAVVVTHDGTLGKQLAAYVVAEPGLDVAGFCERVREALKQVLPDYMVPAHLMLLERLPLSPNGKLDRKALPVPQVVAERVYVAPCSELQRALAEVWQTVLKIERVGMTDNFYELGGDSILSLQVVARCRALKKLGLNLKLRDLVQKPTIAELTADDAPMAGLLSLNSDAPGAPTLVCVHAGFGTVFDYEPLARRLDSRCKVLAIPCRMLFDNAWRDVSLEMMAKDYVALVRERQPQGPYHLLGWSLGATLAALMAAELEGMGEQVAFLGLVDGFVPGTAEAMLADNWQGDLEDFLDLLSPGLSRQVPGLAQEEEHQDFNGLFQMLLDTLPATQIQASRYLGMGAEELANLFVVARRLVRLSRQLPACHPVEAPVHAWWTPGRQADGELLARQLGQPGLAADTIACGHFQIPRDERWLQALAQALDEVVAVSAEQQFV
ncbi:amino acid adenylation domain-containing protein [Pseudomonas sp. VEM90]